MRSSLGCAVALLLAAALAACISAPPAPLDPERSAERLASRSLEDPEVAQALAHAGLSPPASWDLDALTAAAWTLRPEMAAAAADVAAGEAAMRVAEQRPNPTLSLGPGYVTHNANADVSPWVMATALGFTFEIGGKRGIRTAQARAARQVLEWQAAERLWQTRAEVRKALLDWQLDQRALELAEQEADVHARISAWVDTEVRYGAAAQPDRLTAQARLAQAQAQLRGARGDLAAAQAALAASIGLVSEKLPLERLQAATLDELPDPTATPRAHWRELSVRNRLSINHALADYEVAEQDLRMAVARQYPDIGFGPGYTYDKGDSVITLSLGLTLPLLHTERAQIDQALAARHKAATQFEVTQSQALAEVDSALARYQAGYQALLEARAAQAATARVAAGTQRRLEAGAADRGEVLAAQLATVTAQRAVLDALRTASGALGAIENSVQRPVWPPSRLTLPTPVAAATETAK
jgi:outer membrane protein TolC